MAVEFIFDSGTTIYLTSPTGLPYQLVISDEGAVQTAISGEGIPVNMPYLPIVGGVMSGNITLSSGNSLLAEVANLGNDVGSVSTPFHAVYGSEIIATNAISVSGNSLVSSGSSLGAGVSIFSSKTGSILNFNSVTGIGGVDVTVNAGLITISGSASASSSSGVNLGVGLPIFNSLNGSNLQFNSISGIGSLVNAFTIVGDTIIVSGSTSSGTGDVVGPSASVDNSVPAYDGITGKLLKDGTGVSITPSGTLNATVLSASVISGTTLSISGTVFYPNTLVEIDFGSLPVSAKTFTISDARVTSNSLVIVTPVVRATTGRTADDWQWDNIYFSAGGNAGTITLYCNTDIGTTVLGTRNIQYTIY